jgi:hypothetical protein
MLGVFLWMIITIIIGIILSEFCGKAPKTVEKPVLYSQKQ